MKEEKTAFEYVEDRYPAHIEMDRKEEELLQDEVRNLLKDDVKALCAVRNLLKTSETFSNSSGNLYEYLRDREICLSCKGKYSLCPKKNKGYFLDVYYDQDRDEIRTKSVDCSYLRELEKVYGHIVYSNVSREGMFRQLDSFLSFIRNKDSSSMKDSTLLLLSASKNIRSHGKDSSAQGFILKSVNDEKLEINLMKAICFMYARSGIQSAFVDLSMFVSLINDRSYLSKENLSDAYMRMESLPALFLIGFEKVNFLSDEWKKKIFYDLMKKRAQKGKVTYISAKTLQSISGYLSYRLRGTDILEETIDIWTSLFRILKISDFDMR